MSDLFLRIAMRAMGRAQLFQPKIAPRFAERPPLPTERPPVDFDLGRLPEPRPSIDRVPEVATDTDRHEDLDEPEAGATSPVGTDTTDTPTHDPTAHDTTAHEPTAHEPTAHEPTAHEPSRALARSAQSGREQAGRKPLTGEQEGRAQAVHADIPGEVGEVGEVGADTDTETRAPAATPTATPDAQPQMAQSRKDLFEQGLGEEEPGSSSLN